MPHSFKSIQSKDPLWFGLTKKTSPGGNQFSWYNGLWAQESCDIEPDPHVKFGRLANGFRYAIVPGHNPRERISLRLVVQVGSLMEASDELGIAHFLEHLAFKGTRTFRGQTLLHFLEQNGMSFGNDANAHTSRTETVYKLNLSSHAPTLMQDALALLRSVADGLTLSEEALNQERRVILAERKDNDSEAERATQALREFLYAPSRLMNPVIGTPDTLERITLQRLQDFYHTWYRAHRMVLVVCGDVADLPLPSWIEEAFGTMPIQAAVTMAPVGDFCVLGQRVAMAPRDDEAIELFMQIQTPQLTLLSTKERWLKGLLAQMTRLAVNRRLLTLRLDDPNLWSVALFQDARSSILAPNVNFSATTTPTLWLKALDTLLAQIECLKRFGLTQREFDTVKNEVFTNFEYLQALHSQYTNDFLADQFVLSLSHHQVYTSASEDLAIAKRLESAVTLQAMNAYLAQDFELDHVRVMVYGPVEFTLTQLKAHIAQFDRTRVTPMVPHALPNFPYLPKQTPLVAPTCVVERLPVAGETMTMSRFSFEGFELCVLPLRRQQGAVEMEFIFGDGLEGVPPHQFTDYKVAQKVLDQQGVGALNYRETTELIGAKGVKVAELLGYTSSQIHGTCPCGQEALLLEALYTQFMDPHLTEANLARIELLMRQSHLETWGTVEGVYEHEFAHYITGGRALTRALTVADLKGVDLLNLRRLVERSRQVGPRTLLVTGDVDVDYVLARVCERWTGLSAPTVARSSYHEKSHFPRETRKVLTVPGDHLNKAMLAKVWSCPAMTPLATQEKAIRHVVSSFIRHRVRDVIRERLGLTYSPQVTYQETIADDGFAYLAIQIETHRAYLPAIEAALQALEATLLREGIDDATLQSILKPIDTHWRSGRDRNELWSTLVSKTLKNGYPYVHWYERIKADFDAMTTTQVNQALGQFLRSPHLTFIVQSDA